MGLQTVLEEDHGIDLNCPFETPVGTNPLFLRSGGDIKICAAMERYLAAYVATSGCVRPGYYWEEFYMA